VASARRWSVSAGRTVVSTVLGVVAVFLVFVSLGAGSWVLAALGAAVLVAAGAFYVVAALNSREFAYVPGTAHVVSCSPPPASASQGRCEMHLVIHAPGLDDVAVKIRDAGVPVSKWPDAGATLPILVAVGDPRRVRVLWDSVRSHGEVAEGREQEYHPGSTDESYLGDLLDEEYDEASIAGLDPDARVIELDVMDPNLFRSEPADEGPGYSSSISYDPDIALDPDVALDRHVAMADTPPEPEPVGREPEPPRRREPEPPRRREPEPPRGQESQPRPDGAEPPRPAAPDADAEDRSEPLAERSEPAAPGRRPRPSPRPPGDERIPEPKPETVTGGVTTLPEQAAPRRDNDLPPLRVEHVLAADPAVPAMPDSAAAGETDVSSAYLAATQPPDQARGRVRGVGVTLFVTNLGRSLAFYRDLLGFRQVDLGLGSAVLESGDARIVLRRVVDMPPVDRRLIHLLLEVPDVQAAYDELLLQGVEFVHRPRPVSRFEELELWSAAFRDPDGHGIALTNWTVWH
jgi:resuscitation-promoting factor RpfA